MNNDLKQNLAKLSEDANDGYTVEIEKLYKHALDVYDGLVASGVSVHSAKSVLPLDLIIKMEQNNEI